MIVVLWARTAWDTRHQGEKWCSTNMASWEPVLEDYRALPYSQAWTQTDKGPS